jgi:hypothetical protein
MDKELELFSGATTTRKEIPRGMSYLVRGRGSERE